MRVSDTSPTLRPAAYLCSPPQNPRAATGDREALTHFAARLGLPTPVFYLDDVHPSSWGHRSRPQFETLVRAVIDGTHRLLLIPGPWVFSADEGRIRLSLRVLTAAGCTRVLTLPKQPAPVPREHPATAGARPGRVPGQRRPPA
ncbi:hypothetical protein PUR61_18390 [Streptomyces sp. BE20]|uniref:hypothetical protein n=1 Tax=unclassified Streptomyces TaxID=2593676 RepID=UPI002E78E30A|nr:MULTISPECIES: hypothetical protein [unclassified Streptomyces]MED7952285.1 hypothetical protein [Streptomyces sp. BE303]MEE1824141.1 hypothetical protein [Streptomyces sp. BE20]